MNWQKQEDRLTKHQLKHNAKERILDNHRLGACEICYPISEPIPETELAQFNIFNVFYHSLIPQTQKHTKATIERVTEAVEEVARLSEKLKTNDAKNLIRICGHIILNYTYKSR